MKHPPYVHVCIPRLSCFYINLYISFICKDVFTKFMQNGFGYKNMSDRNLGHILKNGINMFQKLKNCSHLLDSSDLHKMFMVVD